MKLPKSLAVLISLPILACQSAPEANVPEPDLGLRGDLLSAVASLEGNWSGEMEGGEVFGANFHVASAGSAIREIMLPGTDHEMTNMYTLDGNSMRMTHYCAGGNQPQMRAISVEGGVLEFVADGVSDLSSADDVYMGAMTLVIIDENHIEQHWMAIKGETFDHEMVFELTRVE